MIRFKIAPFFVILLTLSATLQAYSVTGRVTDRESGDRLAGANIYIAGTRIGTASDVQGHFTLEIPERLRGKFRLVASYVGYHDQTRPLALPLDRDVTVDFALAPSQLYMDQIVVTGTRTERFLKDTPVTTQVIKSREIAESGSNNIADVIQEVTGVTIEQHDRFGSVTDLQGFDSNHILFLVNGIKVIGRLNGQFDISQIPAADIERIEIVKGATSAIYGSQAMGGVINIITRKPRHRLQLNGNLKIGSYRRINSGLTASLPIGAWSSKLFLGLRRFGGFDLDASDPFEDGSRFQKYNASLQAAGPVGNAAQVSGELSYFNERQKRILNNVFEAQTTNNRGEFKLSARADSLLPISVKANLEYSLYRHEYGQIVRSSGFYKASDPTDNGYLLTEFLAHKTLGKHALNAGYSLEHETIRSRRVVNQFQQSVLQSLFIQDEYKLSAALTLLAGARYDHHSIYGQQLSPKISFMFSPWHTGRIRFGYGRGFRAPAFKELFLDFYVSDVNLTLKGNPDLKPEQSDALNLDYEYWNNNNYHVRLNLFYNQITEMISDVRVPGQGLTYTYKNFEKVKTWGGEWDMDFFPTDWLELKMGYRYMDSWVSTTGQALSGKLKHKGHTSLMFSLPHHIKWNIRALFYGPRYDYYIDDATGELSDKIKIPGYVLIHSNLSYRTPWHVKLILGVRNLTDYVKKFWGPMPGREWYAGFSFNY